MVPPPARRHAQVRREPAEALPGHPQRRLGHDGARGALECAQGRRARLVRPRHPRLPRRQPAHEADAVLGVADRRGSRRPPGGDLPGRGVHAPGADDDAREDRLLAVVHLLRVEEHEGRARRVRRAGAVVVGVLPARTCGRTRPTSSTSTSSTAAGRRSRRGSSSRRRSRRATGSTRATRRCENVPVREGSEEYLDSEKYEVKKRTLAGPLLPLIRRVNEIRRAHPALQRFESLTWLETHSDDLIAYAKRDGEDVVITVVNLDPAKRPGRALHPPAGARPAGRLHGRRPARRRELPRGAPAGTTSGSRPAARMCSSSATRRHERSRRGRPLPGRRGPPRAALRAARRPLRRRRRRAVRGLGAERDARSRSSATGTSGARAPTRCGRSSRPGSGRASPRTRARGSATSSPSPAPTGSRG